MVLSIPISMLPTQDDAYRPYTRALRVPLLVLLNHTVATVILI